MIEELSLQIKKGNRSLFGPTVPESSFRELYEELCALDMVKINPHVPIDRMSFFDVVCSPNHAGIPFLLDCLKSFGWLTTGRYVNADLRKTQCWMHIQRRYEKKELERFSYFSVMRWGDYPISALVERQGKRWCAMAEIVDWRQRNGSIGGELSYFVHPSVKDRMEKELKGILFHRLEWDQPDMAKHDYWEIDTPVTMPPCLLPVVPMDDLTFYEEENYWPPELSFKRREVEALGGFDLAWGREWVGRKGPQHGNHLLIVSQKFRKLCTSQRLSAQFNPVRLVD